MASFFSERERGRIEYSGPQEATRSLRYRLNVAASRYLAEEKHLGVGTAGLFVWSHKLHHELAMHLGKPVSVGVLLEQGEYHEVFDAVEIFLRVARETASQRYDEVLLDFQRAFAASGSVYRVTEDGEVHLHPHERTARQVDEGLRALSSVDEAQSRFEEAVAGLLSRQMAAEDVVKNVSVALEAFLRTISGESDFDRALRNLQAREVIAPAQRAVLERLYGYRSDSGGVVHPGGSRGPSEEEALWFLDTVSAQVIYLSRQLR